MAPKKRAAAKPRPWVRVRAQAIRSSAVKKPASRVSVMRPSARAPVPSKPSMKSAMGWTTTATMKSMKGWTLNFMSTMIWTVTETAMKWLLPVTSVLAFP